MSYGNQYRSGYSGGYGGGGGDRFNSGYNTGAYCGVGRFNFPQYGQSRFASGCGSGGQKHEALDPEDEQFRKMFIGGLSLDTTESSLTDYFKKYGKVVDAVVMRDPNTKRSRGFGFVTFDKAQDVNDAQDERPHLIDSKKVETKRAMRREDANNPEAKASVKKVFLGGVQRDATEQDIRGECEKHGGHVETVEIIKNKLTGEGRGFCFVSFYDTDSVDKIFLRKFVDIKGKKAEVKKAQEKIQDGPSRGDGGFGWQDFYSVRGGGGGGGSGSGRGRNSGGYYSGGGQNYTGGYCNQGYGGYSGYSGGGAYSGYGQASYGANCYR